MAAIATLKSLASVSITDRVCREIVEEVVWRPDRGTVVGYRLHKVKGFRRDVRLLSLQMRHVRLLLLLGLASWVEGGTHEQARPNPCPDVYGYAHEPQGGWYGVITIVPPRRFSRLDLVTKTSLVFYRKKAGHGRLVLDGDEEQVSARAQRGERQVLRFHLHFPPYNVLPRIFSIVINDKEFCPRVPAFTDTAGNITSELSVITGVNLFDDDGNDFLTLKEESTTQNPVTSRLGPPPSSPTRRPTANTAVQCGRVHHPAVPLIHNGEPVTQRGQWPWHVAIYRTENRVRRFVCGGSLISLGAAVTAGHCVTHPQTGTALPPKTFDFIVGKLNLRKNTADEQSTQADQIILHHEYNGKSYMNDVAIVMFKKRMVYSDFVRPVCLWNRHWSHDLGDIVGLQGIVVGWGDNEQERISAVLQSATMPVVSQEECRERLIEFYSQYTSDFTFCAGLRNGTSPCRGDSGGGLVFRAPQRDNTVIWFLRGIVSLSARRTETYSCDPKNYVIFTDIAKYLDFLEPFVGG